MATVPFAYRYYPIVREARARVRSGGIGTAGSSTAPTCRTGSSVPTTTTGASMRRPAGRPVPSPTSAPTGATSSSSSRARARGADGADDDRPARAPPWRRALLRPGRRRRRASAASRPRTSRRSCFETDGGALGSLVVSQVSAGRKNRLWFEVSGTDQRWSSTRRTPRRCGWEAAIGRCPSARPRHARPRGRRVRDAARRPSPGLRVLLRRVRRRTYAAIGGASPDGLPTLEDGLRATRITEAVLRSAESRQWVEVEA